MKKRIIYIFLFTIFCLIFIILLNFLFTKIFRDLIIESLPKFKSSECYYGEGVQDYTDYCKYYYNYSTEIMDNLKESQYFKPVKEENKEEIKSYFKNFESLAENQYYKNNYDFKESCIDEKDYFYIENNQTSKKYIEYSDKYSAYNVYFFDIQSMILYFIHSNI